MKWIRKGAAVLIAVLALSFVTFLAFQILPGDPAMMKLGTNATPEARRAFCSTKTGTGISSSTGRPRRSG